MKSNVLCIVGATAVGKTDFAISVAKKINGDVINADSMQIYKYMNIGTAKPTKEQQSEIPHHLINIKYPDEEFNVKEYLKIAVETISKVIEMGKYPIVAGGTGLYLKALLYGIFDSPSRNIEIRNEINNEIEQYGLNHIYKTLCEIDPGITHRIHSNDKKRIIRALEVYRLTGKPISVLQKEQAEKFIPKFDYRIVGINEERDIIYKRIERRCDKMLESGFIDEVKRLREMGYHSELQSMKAIGYSHIHKYLDGKIDYYEMIRLFKRDSRRYAKRQLTLFRSIEAVKWIKIDWNKNPLSYVEELL